MKRSSERVLTTHAGSLPQPDDVLALAQDPAADPAALAARVRRAATDVVAQQTACGLDVVSDGEMSKPSLATYVTERLSGFTRSAEAGELPWASSKEITAFPEFYSPALRQSPNAAAPRFACAGPITYVGQRQVQADIDNLQAALAGARVTECRAWAAVRVEALNHALRACRASACASTPATRSSRARACTTWS